MNHSRRRPRRQPRAPRLPARTTRSTPSPPMPARRSQSRRTRSAVEVERAVGVGQQHEVVLGAVPLDEPDHATRLRRAGSATRPAPDHRRGRQRRPPPPAHRLGDRDACRPVAELDGGDRPDLARRGRHDERVPERGRGPVRSNAGSAWTSAVLRWLARGAATASGRDIPKSRRLSSICSTVVMMVDAAGRAEREHRPAVVEHDRRRHRDARPLARRRQVGVAAAPAARS